MLKEKEEIEILQLNSRGTSLIGEVSVRRYHAIIQIESREITSWFFTVLFEVGLDYIIYIDYA